MKTYADKSTVTMSLEYVDSYENKVVPTSASYRVLDAHGVELLPATPITIVEGDESAEVVINSAINTLVDENVGLRVIELSMNTAAGSFTNKYRYVVERELLIVGVNTLQTYDQAILDAHYISEAESWLDESEKSQKVALIEAYSAISRLRFKIQDDSPLENQSRLTPIYGRCDGYRRVYLPDLSPEEIMQLDSEFLKALKIAQIVEASAKLSGEDDVAEKRASGLLSESIGESSQMFKSGVALKLPMNKAAYKYLDKYIDNTTYLRRG